MIGHTHFALALCNHYQTSVSYSHKKQPLRRKVPGDLKLERNYVKGGERLAGSGKPFPATNLDKVRDNSNTTIAYKIPS